MANDNLKSKILDKNSLKIKSLSFATVLKLDLLELHLPYE